MRFLPKTTCEKLVKIGCKTENKFFHESIGISHLLLMKGMPHNKTGEWLYWGVGRIPAFTLEDFVSTDEYAKENCRKIWPDKSEDGKFSFKYKMNTPKGEWVSHSEFFRQEIIKSKDWVEFISEAVEERSKTL